MKWEDGRSEDRGVLVFFCLVRSSDHPSGRCPVLSAGLAREWFPAGRRRLSASDPSLFPEPGSSRLRTRLKVQAGHSGARLFRNCGEEADFHRPVSAHSPQPAARPSSCLAQPLRTGEVAAAPARPRFMTRLPVGAMGEIVSQGLGGVDKIYVNASSRSPPQGQGYRI